MRVYVAVSASHIRYHDAIAALRLAGHDCFTRPYVDILRQADAVVFVNPSDEMAVFEYGAAIGSGRRIFVVLENERDQPLRFPLSGRIEHACLSVNEVIERLASPLNDPSDEGGDPLDMPIDHAPEEQSWNQRLQSWR